MLTSLRTLWFEPRRSLLRLWIFRIHQWAGVGAGFYLAMMGLTGALSVFLPELRNTLVAPVHIAASQPRLSLQALQDRIEHDQPALRLRAVYPGQTASQADTFEEVAADKTIRQLVVDPYTARVLIDRKKDATFYDWVRDLHANLLSGKTGKTINGFGGLLMLLTLTAGIVVWWPGQRHIKPGTFQVSVRKGLRRLSFDLHRLLGVLILLPLSLAVLTGISQAFPQLAANVAGVVLGPRSEPLRAKQGVKHEKSSADTIDKASAFDTGNDTSSRLISLDEVVQVARDQVQGATPIRIQTPAGKYGGFLVWMHLPSDWRDEGDNRVLIDGRTARLLGVQLGRNMTRSSRTIEGATAIHYGQYGGLPTRVLAVVVGLSLPLLYVSGMVLWWRHVVRLRSKPTNDGAAQMGVARGEVYAAET